MFYRNHYGHQLPQPVHQSDFSYYDKVKRQVGPRSERSKNHPKLEGWTTEAVRKEYVMTLGAGLLLLAILYFFLPIL